MGNRASFIDDYETGSSVDLRSRVIINFLSCQDVPLTSSQTSGDFLSALSDSFVYLRACVTKNVGTKEKPSFERLSTLVATPTKCNCSTAVWNSYRDFYVSIPQDDLTLLPNAPDSNEDDNIASYLANSCYLSIEIVSQNGTKDGDIIGSVHIRLGKFADESLKTFPLFHHKVRFPFQLVFATFILFMLYHICCVSSYRWAMRSSIPSSLSLCDDYTSIVTPLLPFELYSW